MDDNFTLLQIWQVEKNFMLYFNEINSYYELIKNDLEDYDQEDMEILAIDIDNTLTNLTDNFYFGLKDSDEHLDDIQIQSYTQRLHDYIIQNEDIELATDIVEADPHFTPIEEFLEKNTDNNKNPFESILHMEIIKELIYDIYAWAELWYVHHGKDIHDIISSRSNSAIKILSHDPDLDDEHNGFKEGVDSTKAFRSYFISDYDARKIASINAKVNELGKSKKEGSIAKLAALTAVLFTKKVLSKTYKETLTYLFNRFSIKEDPSAYKPAQFRRPSMKGTVPAAWSEAEAFFNSL